MDNLNQQQPLKYKSVNADLEKAKIKMKSDKIKSVIKNLCKSIDKEMKGVIWFDTFCQLLKAQGIMVSDKNLNKIKLSTKAKYSQGNQTQSQANNQINYKDALRMIHPNLEVENCLSKEWLIIEQLNQSDTRSILSNSSSLSKLKSQQTGESYFFQKGGQNNLNTIQEIESTVDRQSSFSQNKNMFMKEPSKRQNTFQMPFNKIKFAKEELFKDFRKFDANSDGKLSKNEIKLGYLKHYGRNVSDDELRKIFETLDTDQNGFIEIGEVASHKPQQKLNLSKQELSKMFEMFDKNKDGQLTKQEVQQGYLKHFGRKLTDDEIQNMFQKFDKDKNGSIDLYEVRDGTISDKEAIARAFKHFDGNKDGKLSREEVKNGFQLYYGRKLSEAELEQIFQNIDQDKNGFIDFNEISGFAEKQNLQKAFKLFDKNADGKLSKEEVRNGYLQHFGRKISDQELNRIFNTLDSDKNGFIDNSEVQNDNERDELRRAFARFDKNKDGKLSKEEIKKGYLKYYKRQLSDKELADMLTKFDLDKNGYIELQEVNDKFYADRDFIANNFNKFDKNQDGRLSKEELKKGFQKQFGKNLSDQDLQLIFRNLDSNNDGYIDTNELQKTILKDKEILKNSFKLFDLDNDGKLSKEEIQQGYLQQYGKKLTDGELKQIFKRFDADKNGYIDQNEVDQIDQRAQLAKNFKFFDTNNDGELSRDEIRQGYLNKFGRQISEQQLNQIFNTLDKNKNGQIDLEEIRTSGAPVQNNLMKFREELIQAFRSFDFNTDGKLSKDEVKLGYLKYYSKVLQESDLKLIFDNFDTDRDGYIEMQEILNFQNNKFSKSTPQKQQQIKKDNGLSNFDSVNSNIETVKLQIAQDFLKFDVNADGKLSKDEIKQGYLKNFNRRLSDEELKRIFQILDTDKDGYIDFKEVTDKIKFDKAFLVKNFDKFDLNKDGKLTKEELKKGYLKQYGKQISDEYLSQVFNELDINKDGYIDQNEVSINIQRLVQTLQSDFNNFDEDKNGRLSKKEIINGFLKYYNKNISYKELELIFKRLDTDVDGYISQQELKNFTIEGQKQDLLKSFKKFDQNRDGQLSRSEVKDGYQKHFNRKLSNQELESIFNVLDVDKNGFIDINEVQNQDEQKQNARQRLYNSFKLFDRNSDGKLSKQEVKNGYLKHFNHKISEADLNKIFNDFDTDKNGFIDLNEVSGQEKYNSKTPQVKKVSSNNKIGLFKSFDKNGDGKLSREEIKLGYQQSFGKNLTNEQLDQIMREYDTDKNNALDLQEFSFLNPVADNFSTLQFGKRSDSKQKLPNFSNQKQNSPYLHPSIPIDSNEKRRSTINPLRSNSIKTIPLINRNGKVKVGDFQSKTTKSISTIDKYQPVTFKQIADRIRERFGNVENCFRFMDTDGDQKIDFNEFRNGLEQMQLRLSLDESRQIFRSLDLDNDGQIDFEEFQYLLDQQKTGTQSIMRSDLSPLDSTNYYSTLDIYQDCKTEYEKILLREELAKNYRSIKLRKKNNNSQLHKIGTKDFAINEYDMSKLTSPLPSHDNYMSDLIKNEYSKHSLEQRIQREALYFEYQQVKKQQKTLFNRPTKASLGYQIINDPNSVKSTINASENYHNHIKQKLTDLRVAHDRIKNAQMKSTSQSQTKIQQTHLPSVLIKPLEIRGQEFQSTSSMKKH